MQSIVKMEQKCTVCGGKASGTRVDVIVFKYKMSNKNT